MVEEKVAVDEIEVGDLIKLWPGKHRPAEWFTVKRREADQVWVNDDQKPIILAAPFYPVRRQW